MGLAVGFGWDVEQGNLVYVRVGMMKGFFLFNRSITCYLDYGGAPFYPDPVCRPAPKVGLDGSTLAPRPTDNAH